MYGSTTNKRLLELDLPWQAIEASPKNANLYCARSAAHLKLDNFVEATADATRAAELDPQSGKAFFRKGCVLCHALTANSVVKDKCQNIINCREAAFNLEEYEAARDAFRAAQTLDFNTVKCRTWIRKCDAELAGRINNSALILHQRL